MSEQQQTIITEESESASKLIREEMQKQETEIIEKLMEQGMVIAYPNREVFQEKMQYAYDTIAAYAGKENVAYFLELVDQSR